MTPEEIKKLEDCWDQYGSQIIAYLTRDADEEQDAA